MGAHGEEVKIAIVGGWNVLGLALGSSRLK